MKKDQKDTSAAKAEGLLAAAAKKIGAAAGAVVALAGAHDAPAKAPQPKPASSGKLLPKNKSRLPRREKKALRKASLNTQPKATTQPKAA